MRVIVNIPEVKLDGNYFGVLNGHIYEVESSGRNEYRTKEKLNGGEPTYLLAEWCVPVEELPEELFKI